MWNAGFPGYLAGGAELISLHNDAYLPILGSKPNALGRPLQDVWSESRDIVGPIVALALAGKGSSLEDQPIVMERDGRGDAGWWTFSCLPVRDETGDVGGVLCVLLETKDRRLAERRLRFQIDLGERLHGLIEPREIMAASAELLGSCLGVGRAGCPDARGPLRLGYGERGSCTIPSKRKAWRASSA
ncbi:PAS domain-containing protein [Roseomonas eburnea]|uniref:PAS domain-containing protein n=1 Tax=Neoroseomonas eburnea TaxID=1346889 RepID=A0A9X9XB22_9PROT|nr:PAS domain-containing protein [Neoroseomonas eburnea]MBR0680908.1 PAS domain-containing protein [Neoroseomonas eburnea]